MNKRTIKNKIIAISGQPVTGKSTTIKALKENLIKKGYKEENIHMTSTGEEFRKYTNSIIELINNLDNIENIEKTKEIESIVKDPTLKEEFIKELAKIKKSRTDFSNFTIEQANNLKEFAGIRKIIDEKIDGNIKKMGIEINKEEHPDDIWIFDSRLAFYNIPEAFSVRLTTTPEIAAKRLFDDKNRDSNDKYGTVEEALKAREARKKGEQTRYKDRYGIDLEDEENYDLIIDTSYSDTEEIAETIDTCLNRYMENKPFGKTWASPKIFIPLQDFRDVSFNKLQYLKRKMEEEGYRPDCVIDTVEVDGRQYIIEGHHRSIVSASMSKTLIPYKTIAKDDEKVSYYGGANARQRVNTLRNVNQLYDYEDFIRSGYKEKDFKYNKIYPGLYEEIKQRGQKKEDEQKNDKEH